MPPRVNSRQVFVSSSLARRAMQIFPEYSPTAFIAHPPDLQDLVLDGYGLRGLPARSSDHVCLVSDFCSSGRDFAPRFLQTVPHGSALALR